MYTQSVITVDEMTLLVKMNLKEFVMPGILTGVFT
jgi:hypothetical protein